MSATGLSRGFSDTSLRCGKSTNVRTLQMFLPLTNLSKSCINDHKLKWAAKEVTSRSQFPQRKNKRIEDQKLNGLKMNLNSANLAGGGGGGGHWRRKSFLTQALIRINPRIS